MKNNNKTSTKQHKTKENAEGEDIMCDVKAE
jgi:hypothetical protein